MRITRETPDALRSNLQVLWFCDITALHTLDIESLLEELYQSPHRNHHEEDANTPNHDLHATLTSFLAAYLKEVLDEPPQEDNDSYRDKKREQRVDDTANVIYRSLNSLSRIRGGSACGLCRRDQRKQREQGGSANGL